MKKIIALTLVLLSSATATETTINRDVANGWGAREMVMTHTRRVAAQKSAKALVSAWSSLGLAQPESSLDGFESTLKSDEFKNELVRSLFKRGQDRNYIDDALVVLPKLREQSFSESINNQQYPMATITTMVMDIIKHYDKYTSNNGRLEIDRDLLQQNLIKNIGDMREDDGHVVCNVGMSQRIMRTLQGYLDGVGIDGQIKFGASENVQDTDTFATNYRNALSNAIERQSDNAILKGTLTAGITQITRFQKANVLMHISIVHDSWVNGAKEHYKKSKDQQEMAIKKINLETQKYVNFINSIDEIEDENTLKAAMYGDQTDIPPEDQVQKLREEEQRLRKSADDKKALEKQEKEKLERQKKELDIADILDQVEAASQNWTPETAKEAAQKLNRAVDMFKNHPDNIKPTNGKSSTRKSNTRTSVSIPESLRLYALKFVQLGNSLLGYASINNVPIPDNFRANKSNFIQSAAGLSFDRTLPIDKKNQKIEKERKVIDTSSVSSQSVPRQMAPIAPLPSMAEPAPEFDITQARFMSLDGQPIPDNLAQDIERLVANPETRDAITQMRQALAVQRLIETQQSQSSDYPEISLKLENSKTELTGLTQSPTQDQANKIAYDLHNLAVDFMNTSDRSKSTFKTLVAEWRLMKQQLDSILQHNQWALPKGVLGNPLKFMEKDVSKWDPKTMAYKQPEIPKEKASRRGDDRSRADRLRQETRMDDFDDARSVISQPAGDNPALDPDDTPQQIETRPESLTPSEISSSSAQDNLAPLMSELNGIETQVASVPDLATAEALTTQLVNFSKDKFKNDAIISTPGITQIKTKWRLLADDLNARIMAFGGKTNAKLVGNPSKFVDKISEPGAGKSKGKR